MATIRINIKAEMANEQIVSHIQSIVTYSRIISVGGKDSEGNLVEDDLGIIDQKFSLSDKLTAEIVMLDYADGTNIDVAVVNSQDSKLFKLVDQTPVRNDTTDEWELMIEIPRAAVSLVQEATTLNPPAVTSAMSARAEFKPTIDREVHFRNYSLLVTAVTKQDLPEEIRKKYFGDQDGEVLSTSLEVGPNAFLSEVGANSINSVPLSMQGQFEFTIQRKPNADAWLWVMSGKQSFAGIVDYDPESTRFRQVLWLPLSETELMEGELLDSGDASMNSDAPIDPSEQELLNNPELFSDDPGTKCKPFRSPHRIVGEKTFHTVLRVTQPDISRDAAAPDLPKPSDFSRFHELDASEFVFAASAEGPRAGTESSPTGAGRSAGIRSAMSSISSIRNAVHAKAEVRPSMSLTPAEEVLAAERAEILGTPQKRRILSGKSSIDWEGQAPAQAASLSFGHILEYRVRWRNNGYSLGNVLYSLPLAPRQTKQIVTVSSEIVDRSRRMESTTVAEEIAQGVNREYGYASAVKAGLSEWAKGGSKSSQTGAAGGIGLAILPVVLGGGASHGRSDSSSWQRAGRKVSGIEEQSLRDSIRQYGESLRKSETVVVQEQSQQETTQAVSEVVRNPNYCHTLTIVYHEILRHLRVDTEVVGARECVFVPLPISPFTWARIIRWRDSLAGILMQPRLRRVMPHLKDVQENFVNSEIPDGERAEQPITFLSGTVFLRLAIERPQEDDENDIYEQARWASLLPFVNQPVREIYDRLKRNADQKDRIFQKDYAPGIATRWADKLTLTGQGGVSLGATDFTLASKYRFGQTVRVDFTCVPVAEINRKEHLENIKVGLEDEGNLPPGSIANVQSVSIRYTTKNFSRSKSSRRAEDDLLDNGNGEIQSNGASINIPLDNWEMKNQQEIIKADAESLRKHLNEHMEHYHKHLWWNMDRDKLYMLLDTIYAVSEEDGRSVASVVERDPIAIMGNNLVYKVAGGAHLKIGDHETAGDLNDYYADSVPSDDPIRVSLPTAGVYAQALLDDCEACEEHFGSTEWILDDKEQELADLDPSMLGSRRATATDLKPSPFPASIINLQNAPNVPAHGALASALGSVTNGDSFRDMAGLAGTQANAKAAMDSAANLASDFGSKALDLEKSRIAPKIAKEKIAVLKKAKESGILSGEKFEEGVSTVAKDLAKEGSEKEEPLSPRNIKKIAESADETDSEIDVDQKKRKVLIRSRNKAKKKISQNVEANVSIIIRDHNDEIMAGKWRIELGSVATIVEVNSANRVISFRNVQFFSEGEHELNLSGGPLLDESIHLSSSSVDNFFFSTAAMITVEDGKDIVITVKQKRRTVSRTYSESKTDTEVIIDVMSAKLGVESGAIAGLLAGKIEGSFTVTESDSESSTTGSSTSFTREVAYPLRTLVVKQKGIESEFIDPED